MKKLIFPAFALIFLIFACKKDAKMPTLKFNKQSVAQKDVDADKDSTSSFNLNIDYLVAESDNPAVAKNINDTLMTDVIMNLASMSFDTTFPKMDLNTAIQKFNESYANELKTRNEVPVAERMNLHYELEINQQEIARNSKVVCISSATYSFSGGAHPNTYVANYVFDLTTGKPIFLENIIKDKAKFYDLVEKNVKKAQEIDEKKSLAEEGFFLDEVTGKVSLPINFALSKDQKSIDFLYNPYEIAAYAVGPIDFSIPCEQLQGILDLEKVK